MAELKRLRDAAGLSQAEVAEQLSWHATKVMRLETGRNAPHPNDVRVMLDLYGVTERERRDGLIQLAKDAKQKGWWYSYRDILLNRYDFFIGMESEASSIWSFELAMIPGLLQTEDYAGALIPGQLEFSPEEVERRIEVRMTRQQVLDHEDRPQLWAIVDEAAIRRVIGGPAVMRGQLERLAGATDDGRTTVQVIPYSAGAHPGTLGPFVILGFPEPSEPDLVYMETIGGNLYVDKPEEARLYTTAFNHLRAVALSPADSRAMLNAAARELR
jgi:transcriptional regulator with XRE-family HTH domain